MPRVTAVPKTQSDSADFIAFWTLWRDFQRSTDGRAKARPAYQQMIEAGADPADILAGARWYLRNLKPEERPYIPLASSWLRSERWADDCILERQHEQRKAASGTGSNVTPIQRTGQTVFLREWNARHGN